MQFWKLMKMIIFHIQADYDFFNIITKAEGNRLLVINIFQ